MPGREQNPGAPAPAAAAPAAASGQPGDSRAHPRVPFQGYPLEVIAKGRSCSVRVRDLSCGGFSGICDEALDVGAFVTVCFAEDHQVFAWVRWVRLMNVGLMFAEPLAPGFVRRLHRGHGTFVTVRPRQ